MEGRNFRRKYYNLDKQQDVEEILELLNNDSELEGDDSDADPTWMDGSTIPPRSLGESDSDSSDDCEVERVKKTVSKDTPGPSVVVEQKTKESSSLKKKKPKFTWGKKIFQSAENKPNKKEFLANRTDVVVKTALEYFHTYFPDGHFEQAATYTNMYCLSKRGKILNTTATEIKQLYGAHLIFGCIPYPRLHWYWKSGIRLQNVTDIFTRDRVNLLRMCLHFVDTEKPPDNHTTNALWKVQPIIDSVRNACLKIDRSVNNYSIDEQMIPFSGRCDLRQFVKGKPRPTGLKNFVLASSTGIALDFEIYQGQRTPLPDIEYGLGPAVVLRLCTSLPEGSFVHFDRYFTTPLLMKRLTELKIYATGTVMNNRINNATFKPDNQLGRGDSEQLSCNEVNMVAVKWKDTKTVTLLSNASGVEPEHTVKRWCKKEKQHLDVRCPEIVKSYNDNMGGVDICDQQLEYYRTFIKTKKWTLKVALHFLDLAVVNSWMQYREDSRATGVPKGKIKDLLNFRMEIGEGLLATPKRKRPNEYQDEIEDDKADSIPKPQNYRAPLPGNDKKHDGYEHFPTIDALTTARFCRHDGCKSRTRTRCIKCNVYLCLTKDHNCFLKFHTK